MAEVFVVEDDSGLRASLVRSLTELGHVVRDSGLGFEALDEIKRSPPDVVVLDLGLPDVDGTQVLTKLREFCATPVIVATGRDDEWEIVALLDAGADDYLVKPYSIAQLDARLRAVLRRAAASTPSRQIVVGDLLLDMGGRVASLGGRTLDLSRKEFELLALLAARADEVVTKREMLAEVWRQPYGGADKTVDVHLSWLRRKLGESADAPVYLHTVRGVGVKLVAP
jgi:DNA-binding response OmpR family regulator